MPTVAPRLTEQLGGGLGRVQPPLEFDFSKVGVENKLRGKKGSRQREVCEGIIVSG
jgi:hypothetical protein